MKKFISILLVGALALSLAACDGNSETLPGKVATDGSTSMEKVIGALKETYEGENKGVEVTYNPTGSSAGITAVAEGRCDIGLSSRNLKDAEVEQGLVGTPLAFDGIAVIINPENTVEDLTVEQIAAVYRGEITNWSEVGGIDAEIVCIGRDASSGTRSGFEEIVGVEDECQYRQELTSNGDVLTTVAGNPGAIGYASVATVKDTVKALKVGGVAPTNETVKDGSYAIQRPFLLVTKGELTGTAKAFFDFITSGQANEVIIAAGVVPAN